MVGVEYNWHKKEGKSEALADGWLYAHTDSLAHVPWAWICFNGTPAAKAREAADRLKIWKVVSKGRFACPADDFNIFWSKFLVMSLYVAPTW
jgi:hypothetical protein